VGVKGRSTGGMREGKGGYLGGGGKGEGGGRAEIGL